MEKSPLLMTVLQQSPHPEPYKGLEVPRVLFLGMFLDFYYSLLRVLLPQFGFHLGWGSISQALVEPYLVPPASMDELILVRAVNVFS